MAAPTSLPSGWGLTDRIFEELFEVGALAEVLASLEAVASPHSLPRLEYAMDVAVSVHGSSSFAVFDEMVDVTPNWNHHLFANHANDGGSHVTANFDLGVEQAGARTGGVFHFHGNVADREALGVTLAKIRPGFDEDTRDRLQSAVESCSTVVVCGYSGSDFFDVDPFIASVAEQGILSGKHMIWIDHGSTELSARHQWQDPPRMYELFEAGGSAVVHLRGESSTTLRYLFPQWAPTGPFAADPVRSPSRRRRSQYEVRGRVLASLELFRRSGMVVSAQGVLDRHPWLADTDPGLAAMSEIARLEGRYRDFRRFERQRWNGSEHRFQRLMSVARSHWYQGRLVASMSAFTALARQASTLEEEVEALVNRHLALAQWIRAEGALIDRLLRLADRSKARISERISEAEKQTWPHHPLPSQSPIIDSILSIEDQKLDTSARTELSLAEADNVAGLLNYRIAQARDANDSSLYFETVHQFRAIGAIGDATRSALAPVASKHLSFFDAVRGVFECQFAPMLRLRYLARHVLGIMTPLGGDRAATRGA